MIYTCPMHPEIEQDMPGNCPKCGMKLVAKDELKQEKSSNEESLEKLTLKNYIPLIAIFTILSLTTAFITIGDIQGGSFEISNTISYFMIGFFLVFSLFKIMDLKGFVEGYRTYDLLAKPVPLYGYIYPFIELSFGLLMIVIPDSRALLFAEFAVMTFSGLGVSIKLAKKEKFQCACLGTFLKVPLTKVTLFEDYGMAILAVVMLALV